MPATSVFKLSPQIISCFLLPLFPASSLFLLSPIRLMLSTKYLLSTTHQCLLEHSRGHWTHPLFENPSKCECSRGLKSKLSNPSQAVALLCTPWGTKVFPQNTPSGGLTSLSGPQSLFRLCLRQVKASMLTFASQQRLLVVFGR